MREFLAVGLACQVILLSSGPSVSTGAATCNALSFSRLAEKILS